jgi:hypothetical protein
MAWASRGRGAPDSASSHQGAFQCGEPSFSGSVIRACLPRQTCMGSWWLKTCSPHSGPLCGRDTLWRSSQSRSPGEHVQSSRVALASGSASSNRNRRHSPVRRLSELIHPSSAQTCRRRNRWIPSAPISQFSAGAAPHPGRMPELAALARAYRPALQLAAAIVQGQFAEQ